MELVIGADIRGQGVGCFDPRWVLRRLEQAFGSDVEYDLIDLLAGTHERVSRTVARLGMPADCLPVQSAADSEQMVSPRYQFRLRVGPAAFVTGRVDRYSVQVVCSREAEFPDSSRSCGRCGWAGWGGTGAVWTPSQVACRRVPMQVAKPEFMRRTHSYTSRGHV
jgi:hypothetical protein